VYALEFIKLKFLPREGELHPTGFDCTRDRCTAFDIVHGVDEVIEIVNGKESRLVLVEHIEAN
jgi:hypothetical protein